MCGVCIVVGVGAAVVLHGTFVVHCVAEGAADTDVNVDLILLMIKVL